MVDSGASLAANVAVTEPTATGRVIAAWPSFALIASYELLMRQVRRAAEASRGMLPGGGRVGAAGKFRWWRAFLSGIVIEAGYLDTVTMPVDAGVEAPGLG